MSSTHNSLKHLKEHLNGIYELAVESGFKLNVSKYCKQTFGENTINIIVALALIDMQVALKRIYIMKYSMIILSFNSPLVDILKRY